METQFEEEDVAVEDGTITRHVINPTLNGEYSSTPKLFGGNLGNREESEGSESSDCMSIVGIDYFYK